LCAPGSGSSRRRRISICLSKESTTNKCRLDSRRRKRRSSLLVIAGIGVIGRCALKKLGLLFGVSYIPPVLSLVSRRRSTAAPARSDNAPPSLLTPPPRQRIATRLSGGGVPCRRLGFRRWERLLPLKPHPRSRCLRPGHPRRKKTHGLPRGSSRPTQRTGSPRRPRHPPRRRRPHC
jgi:hypothetical protein